MITLNDGLAIGYAEYGDPMGEPLFSFHGTPGSRIVSQIYDLPAKTAGLRLIAPERPGYGLSDPAPHRHLEDYPAEIAEIADTLGLKQFRVIGTSGGGIYAAACAAKLPERVIAAGLVSTMLPFYLPDVMRGMARANRFFFTLARWLPGVAGFLVARMTLMSLASADRHVQAGTSPISDIRPQSFATVVEDLRTALRPGGAGVALDLANLWRPLAFRLEEIHIPVLIWHGESDNLAPVTSGHYLAARIPNSQATFYPGEGHTDPMEKHGEVIMTALREAGF